MFKTKVKKALVDYTYDRIQQKEGVVRIDFFCTLMDKDKKGITQALKSLIQEYSCNDIYVSFEERNSKTYLFVYKGDKYQKEPSIIALN